jgi:hypothetical protein
VRERKLAICAGGGQLAAAQRTQLLALLAEDHDELVRERAGNALLTIGIPDFLAALNADAPPPQLFRHCGRALVENPEIAAALLEHPRCPVEFLPAAARHVPTAEIQKLLDDLDKLSATPVLAAALLASTSLTAQQREQLQELTRQTAEPPESFMAAAADAEHDPAKRVTLLQRLARMRVVERVQLALKGNREERMILIRDPCKVVQRAVLQSSRITDREVEGFAAMANLSDEILRLIANNRTYRRNYTVVKNLINNPKTPLDISLHLLPNITPTDLKMLTSNKNVSDTLRTAAIRLNRQRNEARNKS